MARLVREVQLAKEGDKAAAQAQHFVQLRANYRKLWLMLLGPFTNLSFVLSRHVHWCNASAKCASTENFPQPMTLPSSRPSWLCSPARRAARNHLGLFRHWITRRCRNTASVANRPGKLSMKPRCPAAAGHSPAGPERTFIQRIARALRPRRRMERVRWPNYRCGEAIPLGPCRLFRPDTLLWHFILGLEGGFPFYRGFRGTFPSNQKWRRKRQQP